MNATNLATLKLGPKLGDGGQGAVYELADDPARVFKRYHSPSGPGFAASTLDALIGMRGKLSNGGRPVDEWAAWPSSVVRDAQTVVGFLMPRVPTEFTFQAHGKRRLSELGVLLAKKSSPLFAGVTLPTLEERIAILRSLARAVGVLHEHRIVIGDLSFANIFWSLSPEPRVMLIDCDGMRPDGLPPVLPQAETPDWDDPFAAPRTAPTFDRDCYKLALAVMRVLGGEIDCRPTELDGLAFDGVEKAMDHRLRELLRQAAGPEGTRPSARVWETALSDRVTVPVQPTMRRTVAAPKPKPELLGTGERKFRPVTPPKR
ncbi:hypothetical protein CS378_24360 [Rhodococcus ruber]|uniref:hypothetical protein n=1 Tax=Rhodococcus TaxID=1827 RepID=UPI00029A2809|nr:MULTISPECIES: hypothetical protein [Rhodococcus]ATQ31569.1 hypothetical protein CS378_24360 [Rhodococcus ruber]